MLSDVRDKLLGKERMDKDSFKWFGLKGRWYPEVIY